MSRADKLAFREWQTAERPQPRGSAMVFRPRLRPLTSCRVCGSLGPCVRITVNLEPTPVSEPRRALKRTTVKRLRRRKAK
jgi:hypothetical protein